VKSDPEMHLIDCTEFRRTLLARPPRIVHGTLLLSVSLLGVAASWAALTTADLVVRAPGRVRPMLPPIPVRVGARGEILSASLGGRVVEVAFHEGQDVSRGQMLLRLDTGHLTTEIAKKRQAIVVRQHELEELRRLRQRLEGELLEAEEKARAELAQAKETEEKARQRRESDLRLARADLDFARREEAEQRKLQESNATTHLAVDGAILHVQQAREQLLKAQQPIDENGVRIAQRAVALVRTQYATRSDELRLKIGTKEGELADAQKDLENLQLEEKEATVLAPASGIVTRGEVQVGTLLEPGQVVAEIAAQTGFLFEADVPNEEVAHLSIGLPARVRLDAYDHQQFGTVPGTLAQIAVDAGQRPASYLIKIKLERDEVVRGDERGKLKFGMTGQVEIVTERESLLRLLLKRIRRSISLG
jgi:multidrug efflux pump subunit AcrA (membrane-fusion protein)